MAQRKATTNKINTREIALQIILAVLEEGEYSHLVLKSVLDKYAYLDKTDRSFIKRLSEGVIERRIELDYIIDQFSKTKVSKMKPMIRSILRMGVYQIFYMEKVPDNAACNESVKLAQAHQFTSLKGFVNGVLRNIARAREQIKYPDKTKEPAQYLSIIYSMPEWIVSKWLAKYGLLETEAILKGLLETRPVMIRLNVPETAQEALIAELTNSGVKLQKSNELAYAYQISGYDRIESLPGFADGRFMVQDTGSMMITHTAGIKPGDFVVDVCGAPGGKAIHAAFLTGEKGKVSVRDISEYKVSLIKENLQRTGFQNVSAIVWDATVLDETMIAKADVVIADLPCSGLGVIGRKADIKYRLKPEDIEQIADLQRQILDVVQNYVKPGGVLMYSTCTLTEEENEQNVQWFLEHYAFRMTEQRTLLPGQQNEKEDETDGFFMARFERVG